MHKAIDIIKKIQEIPTLPSVVIQAIKILNDPNSSAKDVAKIISTDNALTTSVLKLVNSAYFGFIKPITTVSHAVSLLGSNIIRGLIFSVSTADLFTRKKTISGLDRKALWQHSLATAVAAKILANNVGYQNFKEDAFVAGLLHDIGKIILDEYDPKSYKKAIVLTKKYPTPLYKAENEIFGFNHSEIGEIVCEKWKIPELLLSGIRFHHETEKAQVYIKFNAIIHIANVLALESNIGANGDLVIGPVNLKAANLVQLNKLNLEKIQKQIKEDFNKLNIL